MIVLAITGWWTHRNRSESVLGSGQSPPQLVQPVVDADRLLSLAAGHEDGAWFAQAVEQAAQTPARQPGRVFLKAGLATPTLRIDGTYWGWPILIYTASEYPNYEYIALRQGFLPARADVDLPFENTFRFREDRLNVPPRSRWRFAHGAVSHLPPPEETSGVETRREILITGLLGSIGILVVVWWTTAGLLRLVNVFRRPDLRISARRWAWLAVGAGGLLLVTLSGALAVRTERFIVPHGDFANLGMTVDDLKAVSDHDAGGQQLARRIADALGTVDQQPNAYLAIVAVPESKIDYGTFTRWEPVPTASGAMRVFTYNESRYVRQPEFGDPVPITYGSPLSVQLEFGRLSFHMAAAEPKEPTRVLTAHLAGIGTIIVFLFVLWGLSSLGCAGLAKAIARRRVRRSKCAACGYILAPQGIAPDS